MNQDQNVFELNKEKLEVKKEEAKLLKLELNDLEDFLVGGGGQKTAGEEVNATGMSRQKLKHDIDKTKEGLGDQHKALGAIKSVSQVREKVFGTKKSQLLTETAKQSKKLDKL